MIREYQPTTCDWRPASEPPKVAEGKSVDVIVVRQLDNGKRYRFAATYSNKVDFENTWDDVDPEDVKAGLEKDPRFTGFSVDCEECEVSRPHDQIILWAPMPQIPEAPK